MAVHERKKKKTSCPKCGLYAFLLTIYLGVLLQYWAVHQYLTVSTATSWESITSTPLEAALNSEGSFSRPLPTRPEIVDDLHCPAANATRHCKLGDLGLPGPVYLWSMVAADSYNMLEHFLQHYIEVGVPVENMRFLLHATNDASRQRSLAVFAKHGINLDRNVNVTQVTFSSNAKRDFFNQHIASLPSNAWLTYPDLDEFFHYPCSPLLPGITIPLSPMAEPAGLVCVGGSLRDRLPHLSSPIGRVVPGPTIESQFPTCHKVRFNKESSIVHGQTYKNLLFPVQFISPDSGQLWKARTLTAHVLAYYKSPPKDSSFVQMFCGTFGSIDHYAWSEGQLELAAKKLSVYTVSGNQGNGRVYEQILSLVTRNGNSTGPWYFKKEAAERITKERICCPVPAD